MTPSSTSPPPIFQRVSSFFGCPPPVVSDDVIPPLDPSVEVMPVPDSSATTVMARCSDCHHMMPEANLAIHQATAHHARPPLESESATTQQPTAPPEELDSPEPPKRNIFSDVMRIFQPRQNNNDNENRDTTADRDTEDWQLVRHSDAVDEWTCSRCTLRNPRSSERCSACNYTRQEATAPDSRREPATQTQPSPPPPQQQGPVPGAMMGGGALLGGIVGALIGAASGNPIGGAIEGAMNGAMGGAFLETASRNQQQEEARRLQQMQRHRQHQSRRNGMQQMARIQFPDGSVRIVPLSSLNRHQLHQLQRMTGNDMALEQVLQSSLGDASPSLGADEQLIASIPTTRVEKDPPKEDKCPICLESFKKGDTCKTLPCMHGFHSRCVDQWLRTNASCPMCKHSIR